MPTSVLLIRKADVIHKNGASFQNTVDLADPQRTWSDVWHMPDMQLKHFYTNVPHACASMAEKDDYACCVTCGELLSACKCVCEFCGERDACECALFDSATGGG